MVTDEIKRKIGDILSKDKEKSVEILASEVTQMLFTDYMVIPIVGKDA